MASLREEVRSPVGEPREDPGSTLESGAPVMHSIYLDLKRAFDRCPFKLLIVRMKKAGITDKVLKYISNFLRDRTFRVIANGSISEGRPVLSEMP